MAELRQPFWAAKQSPINIGSHACIEMQLFSHGKHGLQARAPNDDIAQQGGLTRVNPKSCSLGLQRASLTLNIHAMVN